jgi:hypothetical protein
LLLVPISTSAILAADGLFARSILLIPKSFVDLYKALLILKSFADPHKAIKIWYISSLLFLKFWHRMWAEIDSRPLNTKQEGL